MPKQAKQLETITMAELSQQDFGEIPWAVENLIPIGITIIAAPPKSAKSFLALQIGLSVAFGIQLMGTFPTTQGEVLCLFLEDTFRRIHNRLNKMAVQLRTDVKTTERGVYFATRADTIGGGLIDQLDQWMADHPGISLIVIDTLQKIRDNARSDNIYASDYSALGKIKEYADDHRLAIVIIHHTRKMAASDPFDTISGSYGVSGAADASLVIQKESHMAKEAELHVTGRDMESAIHRIAFNGTSWDYIDTVDVISHRVPACVTTIEAFIEGLPEKTWKGTASDLIIAAEIAGANPSALSRALNNNADYLSKRGIVFSIHRSANERTIAFSVNDPERL